MAEDFESKLLEALSGREKEPLCTSLIVNEVGGAVTLYVDTDTSDYGEHIPGEGADICIFRDRETNKVVGVRLPLKYRRLVVSHPNGEVTFDTPKETTDG